MSTYDVLKLMIDFGSFLISLVLLVITLINFSNHDKK